MAVNLLKTQEIRLNEINNCRINLEKQVEAVEELMLEDINLETDLSEIRLRLSEKEGDYTFLSGLLRTNSPLESIHAILLAEVKDAKVECQEAEVQFLREVNKARTEALEILTTEIVDTRFSFDLKKEDYREEDSKVNRRAVRELEMKLEMLREIRNTLLGQ